MQNKTSLFFQKGLNFKKLYFKLQEISQQFMSLFNKKIFLNFIKGKHQSYLYKAKDDVLQVTFSHFLTHYNQEPLKALFIFLDTLSAWTK